MSSIPQPPGRESPSSLQTPTPPAFDEPPRSWSGSTTGGPKPRRRIGVIIAISVLSLSLIGVGVVLAQTISELERAVDIIEEQQREIDEQREIIDQKETFSQAATDMMAAAAVFDGLPFADIVDRGYHETLIQRGWTHRWNPVVLRNDIDDVRSETTKLRELAATANAERASNASGTFFEQITDELGRGFIATSLTASTCGSDAFGCVSSDNPYLIHYDHGGTVNEPYMNDWLRTGVAYHEYAHVLQFTNPEQTDTAVASFGGNVEHMADCYALTYLDGWTLDHRIWVGAYTYWDVSIGYGYTCTEPQRRVIREWVQSLTYEHRPISQ